jgi:hypothetical protein
VHVVCMLPPRNIRQLRLRLCRGVQLQFLDFDGRRRRSARRRRWRTRRQRCARCKARWTRRSRATKSSSALCASATSRSASSKQRCSSRCVNAPAALNSLKCSATALSRSATHSTNSWTPRHSFVRARGSSGPMVALPCCRHRRVVPTPTIDEPQGLDPMGGCLFPTATRVPGGICQHTCQRIPHTRRVGVRFSFQF